MPIVEITPVGKSERCEVRPNGAIHFTQIVINRTGWRAGEQGDHLNVHCLLTDGALILLFAKTSPDQPGFKLHFLSRNTTGGSGGELRCARLATQILRPRIALPIRDIVPIFLEKEPYPYQLAFILQLPDWIESDFSQTAAETVPNRVIGVYALMTNDRKIYRYGEGVIQTRMKEHLKSAEHTRVAKRFAYFTMPEKSDAELIEYLLLLRYKQQNSGQLPLGNRITA